MGCFGARSAEKGEVEEQQKWDYITLTDFHGRSCGFILSYVWLWILVLTTIAVYVADTFTAVRLLAFDEWSSEIKPTIPFLYAKWIFAGCIIASWALAIYAWISAIRCIKRGCVTEDYLNSMAVTLQSIRMGTGWRRFLVFAALTKSKKKVSWIAIFVYFQRQGAIRLLIAEGPRQAINALTLYSVFKANLIDAGKGADRNGFDQFFYNLKTLGEKNQMQTIILSTMTFTLVIWVISMIFLILAFILYIFFLWHYIKNETLTGFCRRKVEARLARIVKAKSDKVLAKQQKKWEKAERRGSPTDSLASTLPPKFSRQPTLPMFATGSPPGPHVLLRGESNATLPPYTSQASMPSDGNPPDFKRQPTLPTLSSGRPPLSRPGTGLSDASFNSDAPLLSQAGAMGYSDPMRPGMNRSMTGSSQRSFAPNTMQGRPPLPPLATQAGTPGPRYPPPSRSNTGFSQQSRVSPMSASTNNYTPLSAQSNRPLLSNQSPMSPWDSRTQSPGPGIAYEMTPVESRGYDGGGYFPPQPGMMQRAPTLPPPQDTNLPPSLQIRRDISAPPRAPPPSGALPWPPTQRSATAPVPNEYRGPMQRSRTAGPQGW